MSSSARSSPTAAGAYAPSEGGIHSRVCSTRAVNFFAELKPGALREAAAALRGSQVEALRLVLESESSAQRDQLSSYIPWLATIGSVSPLVGLLGTVLGVIHAFIGIAVSGSG